MIYTVTARLPSLGWQCPTWLVRQGVAVTIEAIMVPVRRSDPLEVTQCLVISIIWSQCHAAGSTCARRFIAPFDNDSPPSNVTQSSKWRRISRFRATILEIVQQPPPSRLPPAQALRSKAGTTSQGTTFAAWRSTAIPTLQWRMNAMSAHYPWLNAIDRHQSRRTCNAYTAVPSIRHDIAAKDSFRAYNTRQCQR